MTTLMKMRNKIIGIFLIALVFSCKEKPSENQQNFDWLLGSWIRTNDQESKKTFENWEKKNDNEYSGFSYTMQNNDTIWQERVKLTKTNENWSFDVTGKGETAPTKFRLTSIKKVKFVCENKANEFPTKIEYSKKQEQLHATISGNGTEVSFYFERNSEE